MKTNIAAYALLFCISVLSGCEDDSQSSDAGKQLQVDAGPAQTVQSSSRVSIQAIVSHIDEASGHYQWQQISGPEIQLDGVSQAHLQFNAPSVAINKQFEFKVEVGDVRGHVATDTTVITVLAAKSEETTYTLSGEIVVADGHVIDSDVNDPNSHYADNNSIETAQLLSLPIRLSGYVNRYGKGAEGRSKLTGDTVDYYRVNLLAGQQISLHVADISTGDVDLYLYNIEGVLVDGSIEITATENIQVNEEGEYYIAALAYSGASNYYLYVGEPSLPSMGSLRLSNDFVSGMALSAYTPTQMTSRSAAKIDAYEDVEKHIQGVGYSIDKKLSGGQMLLKVDGAVKASNGARARSAGATQPRRFLHAGDEEKLQTLLAIKALRKHPSLSYVEPNFIRKKLFTPNDVYYPRQWNFPLIQLPEAWDLTTGNPSVVVAVLDTGVLFHHSDLQGQLLDGFDFISDPFSANDGDGIDNDASDPGDGTDFRASSFHGTHVAGIIGASSNNGEGVSGVSWQSKILPVRVLGLGGEGTSYDINQALLYAAGLPNVSGFVADPPADIINLSLGGQGFSMADQDTIDQVQAAGVIVVAAAGNNGDRIPFYPASYDGVISVAAVDTQRVRAPYSNYFSTVDIAAPGGDARADLNNDGDIDAVLSTSGVESNASIHSTFVHMQGTSMATPHVAGVIALMKSVNSSLTASSVNMLLEQGVLSDDVGDVGRDEFYGVGIINAFKAVSAALMIDGVTPLNTSWLQVTPLHVDFSLANVLQIHLDGFLSSSSGISQISSNADWLSVEALRIDNMGLGVYQLSVDRTGLMDGRYHAEINFSSADRNLVLKVDMLVDSHAEASEAGFTYVVLLDVDTGELSQQTNVVFDGTHYSYSFYKVEPGRYNVVAGSDYDNDFYLCDAAELCGAYGGLENPLSILLDSDKSGLIFEVGISPASDSNWQGIVSRSLLSR